MKKMLIVCALSLVWGLCQADSGEFYRWRVAGKWVYGDKYPADAVGVERMSKLGVVEQPKEGKLSPNEKALVKNPITAFANDCPGCLAAKSLLGGLGVSITYKDPSILENYEEFKKFSPSSVAPVILVGDKVIVGYDPEAIKAALLDAGFEFSKR